MECCIPMVGIPEHFGSKEKGICGAEPVFPSKIVLQVNVLNNAFFGTYFWLKWINPGNACLYRWQRHVDLLCIGVLAMRCRNTKVHLRLNRKGLRIGNRRTQGVGEPVPGVHLVGRSLVIITTSQVHRGRKT